MTLMAHVSAERAAQLKVAGNVLSTIARCTSLPPSRLACSRSGSPPPPHAQALPASSGQVEHDLDGARLGAARCAVEGGRGVLGREGEAVRDTLVSGCGG